MQLEITYKPDGTSYAYDDINHIPRIGEELTIFDDTYGKEGEVIIEGIVNSIQWAFGNGSDDYTVSITIIPKTERPD